MEVNNNDMIIQEINTKPTINEAFADNGAHSHWELIDSNNGKILWSESQASDKDKEIEGLRQWVEDLVRENTSLKKEINTLNEDYTAEVKKSEKLKALVQKTDRSWYIAFYRNVSTLTARQIEEGWVKHWKEKFEYSLQENTPEK